MAYFSDVAIAMKKEDFQEMLHSAEKHSNPRILEFITEGRENGEKHSPGKIVVLYWENVKWYEDDIKYYPAVFFIEEFLKKHPHDIIKSGEDYDDVYSHYGLGIYVLGLKKQIVFAL